ncbi:MAG: hypothetical protein R3Y53_06320 [Bacillota bacterium]
MEYFEKKLTYLRGLCDGSGFSKESNEGKIFHGIIEVLDDMAFMLETYMEDDEFDDMDLTSGIFNEDEPFGLLAFRCPFCEKQFEFSEESLDTETEIPCPYCKELIPIEDGEMSN